VAIIKDRHVRIIIARPEITLHLEAGYIFADCSRRNRFFSPARRIISGTRNWN